MSCVIRKPVFAHAKVKVLIRCNREADQHLCFHCRDSTIHLRPKPLKDRDSTALKRGSVFIGLMTSDGANWSRYQRAV